MAIITLRGKAKQKHLQNLLTHLAYAQKVKSLSNTSQLAEISYLLHLLHGEEEFSPYDEIKIEDERSGFPHYGTILTVATHRSKAEEFLAALPTEGQLAERCLQQLHTDNTDFSPLQQLARRRKFYSTLQQQPLPAVEQYQVIGTERIEDFMAYGISYEGYEVMKMRYLKYNLTLFQRGNSPFLRDQNIIPQFLALFKPQIGFAADDVFYHLNQQSSFAVISVESLVTGPFFTHYTRNQGTGMENILTSNPEEHVLEIGQQICEDTDSYLTSDLDGALRSEHKEQTLPQPRYKRHFFCSTQELALRMERAFSADDRFIPRFYTPEQQDEEEKRQAAAEEQRRNEEQEEGKK